MNYKETEKLELKEKFNDSLVKEIVAFLNTNGGGKIIVGINDKGDVVGIENIDKTQQDIANVISDQISPKCDEFVHQYVKLEKNVQTIHINIEHDDKNLYYIKKYGLSEKGCYVRSGTTCRGLTHDKIKKRYSKTIVKPSLEEITSNNQELTFVNFKFYLSSVEISFNNDDWYTFAKNFKLLDKDGRYNKLAYLLSDQFDESIKVCRFSGENKELVMRKEFCLGIGSGCIFKIYNEIKDYMQSQVNIMRTSFYGGKRKDDFLYDQTAFEEAWKNAIIHNDYTTKHYPQIFLYDNSLEIMSHGNVLQHISKDEFYRGESKPVNPQLAKIAMNLKITENVGKGNRDIVRMYDKKAFEFLENTLLVKIPYDKSVIKFNSDFNNNNIPKTIEDKIIELIKKNNTISIKEIVAKTNMSKSTILRTLKSSKKIIRVHHWEILNN